MVGRSTPRCSVVAAMVVAGLVGCATTDTQPSASVATLAPNAQQWFKIDWTAEPDHDGERRLQGYVVSALGEPANRVQLLAQALDESGNVVGHRLYWMPGVVPALGRAYFEIPNMPAAPQYRITVWAYDRLRGTG
jgi:hypothetical protein